MENTGAKYDENLVEQIAEHYDAILRLIGEDPNREGLLKTPKRAAKALLDITQGYRQDPIATVQQAIFEYEGSKMVVVRDIEFYSMCEHHILPFFGNISIAYIPKGKMIGLSKLARLVDCFAKRLQVQERLTSQICQYLQQAMPTDGVMVICKGEHLCMKMRGVEKQTSVTTTMEYTGKFEDDRNLRNEFMALL